MGLVQKCNKKKKKILLILFNEEENNFNGELFNSSKKLFWLVGLP